MLKINRKNAKTDYYETYKVYIDDMYVTDIKNNEMKDIDVKGKHKIFIKGKKFKSNILEVDIDGIVEVLIEPNYYDNFLSKFMVKILYGNTGIKLSIKNDIFL